MGEGNDEYLVRLSSQLFVGINKHARVRYRGRGKGFAVYKPLIELLSTQVNAITEGLGAKMDIKRDYGNPQLLSYRRGYIAQTISNNLYRHNNPYSKETI